jgi:hypothetical protein
MSISLEARNCDLEEKTPPATVGLFMTDDRGNVLMGSAKNGVQCKNDGPGGNDVSFKRNVTFTGPLNCAGGDVPNRTSDGDITSRVTVEQGGELVDVFTTIVNLHCVEGKR